VTYSPQPLPAVKAGVQAHSSSCSMRTHTLFRLQAAAARPWAAAVALSEVCIVAPHPLSSPGPSCCLLH
jgi:hypothetical protein